MLSAVFKSKTTARSPLPRKLPYIYIFFATQRGAVVLLLSTEANKWLRYRSCNNDDDDNNNNNNNNNNSNNNNNNKFSIKFYTGQWSGNTSKHIHT